MITESYKNKIKNLKKVSLLDYFNEGINLNNDSILKAMDYFTSCMPSEIKEFLITEDYWSLFYNSKLSSFLIEKLEVINESHKKILETFVYTYNCDKREFAEAESEQNLREKLTKEGFKEVIISKNDNLKELDGLKVCCVFDRDKIGFLGSFTEKQTHEGKLIFNGRGLCFLPKRHTKTGQILISNFYYKELVR